MVKIPHTRSKFFSINLNTQKHQTGIIQKYSVIGDIMRFNNSFNLARFCSISSSDIYAKYTMQMWGSTRAARNKCRWKI